MLIEQFLGPSSRRDYTLIMKKRSAFVTRTVTLLRFLTLQPKVEFRALRRKDQDTAL